MLFHGNFIILFRDTIPYTRRTLLKIQNVNAGGRMCWADWLGGDSKLCFVPCQASEGNLLVVWLLAWNTLKLRLRQAILMSSQYPDH
jgi:hypothetical protein